MSAPDLHPDVAALGFLVGRWTGAGTGEYPTVAPFAYTEEWTFTPTPKPFLAFQQRSWASDDHRPLSSCAGFWRVAAGRLEVVLAHGSGITTIEEGTVDGTDVHLATRAVGMSSSAKLVEAVERDIATDGDTLRYTLRLAAVGVPLTPHLAAELRRA